MGSLGMRGCKCGRVWSARRGKRELWEDVDSGSAFVGVDVGGRGGRDGRCGQRIPEAFLDPVAVGLGVVHCGSMKASGVGWDIDMRSVMVRLGLVWFGSWSYMLLYVVRPWLGQISWSLFYS